MYPALGSSRIDIPGWSVDVTPHRTQGFETFCTAQVSFVTDVTVKCDRYSTPHKNHGQDGRIL